MDTIALDTALDRRLLPTEGGRRFLRLTLRARSDQNQPTSCTRPPATNRLANITTSCGAG